MSKNRNLTYHEIILFFSRFHNDFKNLPSKDQDRVFDILQRHGGVRFDPDALLSPPKLLGTPKTPLNALKFRPSQIARLRNRYSKSIKHLRFYFCQYQLKMSPAWDRIRPKPASSVDGTRQGKSPSDGKTTTVPTTTIIQDEATEEEDADVEEKGVGTSAAATTTTYDEGNISCCCRCRYLWQINQHIS